MNGGDSIPFIHSARLNRIGPDKGWLYLNLGAVQLRSITVYRMPHSATFRLLCPGSTDNRDRIYPYIVLSAEFEEIIGCLLGVLWERSEPKSGQTALPISVEWFAKARR